MTQTPYGGMKSMKSDTQTESTPDNTGSGAQILESNSIRAKL
jgi:hypothetical protein